MTRRWREVGNSCDKENLVVQSSLESYTVWIKHQQLFDVVWSGWTHDHCNTFIAMASRAKECVLSHTDVTSDWIRTCIHASVITFTQTDAHGVPATFTLTFPYIRSDIMTIDTALVKCQLNRNSGRIETYNRWIFDFFGSLTNLRLDLSDFVDIHGVWIIIHNRNELYVRCMKRMCIWPRWHFSIPLWSSTCYWCRQHLCPSGMVLHWFLLCWRHRCRCCGLILCCRLREMVGS